MSLTQYGLRAYGPVSGRFWIRISEFGPSWADAECFSQLQIWVFWFFRARFIIFIVLKLHVCFQKCAQAKKTGFRSTLDQKLDIFSLCAHFDVAISFRIRNFIVLEPFRMYLTSIEHPIQNPLMTEWAYTGLNCDKDRKIQVLPLRRPRKSFQPY